MQKNFAENFAVKIRIRRAGVNKLTVQKLINEVVDQVLYERDPESGPLWKKIDNILNHIKNNPEIASWQNLRSHDRRADRKVPYTKKVCGTKEDHQKESEEIANLYCNRMRDWYTQDPRGRKEFQDPDSRARGKLQGCGEETRKNHRALYDGQASDYKERSDEQRLYIARDLKFIKTMIEANKRDRKDLEENREDWDEKQIRNVEADITSRTKSILRLQLSTKRLAAWLAKDLCIAYRVWPVSAAIPGVSARRKVFKKKENRIRKSITQSAMSTLQSLMPQMLSINEIKGEIYRTLRNRLYRELSVRGLGKPKFKLGELYTYERHVMYIRKMGASRIKSIPGWLSPVVNAVLPGGWDKISMKFCKKMAYYSYYDIMGGGETQRRTKDLNVMIVQIILRRINLIMMAAMSKTKSGQLWTLSKWLKFGHGGKDLKDALDYIDNMPDEPAQKDIKEVARRMRYTASRSPDGLAFKEALNKLAIIFEAVGSLNLGANSQ